MRFSVIPAVLALLVAVPQVDVRPGDDFYAHANAAWLKTAAIPAGKPRWGAREELEALARQRIAGLIDVAGSAPKGSPPRKVADFRAAYLDTASIEVNGLKSLAPDFDAIEKVSDKTQLARLLAHSVRADVDPMGFGVYQSSGVLGLAVQQSIHGEPNNVAFLVQGGLGLADRDDYVSAEPAKVALRSRYREYIGKMLALAGLDRAAERGSAVFQLETLIASTQGTREASSNDRNADNVWTRSDLDTRATGMDWAAFLAEAGLARESRFVVWQPSAITGLAAAVASQPLDTWKDYLRFHAVHAVADVLPRAFADEALALRVVVSGGPAPARPERARVATETAMRDAIGRMYAERYFPADQKARVERISDNVRAALIKRVEASTWMSPATKAASLVKLRTLYVGIGYPDTWPDQSSLTVDSTNAVVNLHRVADRDYRAAIARVGKPVDLKYWYGAPQTVGALLVFQQNSYTMSAALLEAPKYDHASSDAAAYGSVGALIGHDLTHYIDVLGADYDTDHRMRHWWTSEDMTHFLALAQPLSDQFSSYRPFDNVSINGKLTLTENIADLGGLAAAFDAYRQAAGPKNDREFFLAYAQTQRRKITDEALRTQAATSDHAPEEYRADTVRNMDAWYEAFDVRPGQRLYVAPPARVRIW